jgi:cation diffusion facilitator CzcD-associated flavoprotein CzcO
LAANYADVSITVDGTGAVTTPTYRHSYTGNNGTVVKGVINAVPVTVPVDGNAHTIRITHAGAAGQFFIVDCILVPSTAPNTIACVGVEHDLIVHASGLDATDVALYKGNSLQVHAAYKSVVAEFPHAVYVPSTMTSNGLWSGDGVHPNDRGMQQRCNDVSEALKSTIARNKNRILSAAANSNFAVV